MTRLISDIANEIQELWRIPYTHTSRPYLMIMLKLKHMNDYNGLIPAKDIITSFLSTSFTAFKGDDAKRIREELKIMVDSVKRVNKSITGLEMGLPAQNFK